MVDRRGLAATMLAGLLFGTSVPVIKLGWMQRDLFRSRKIWIIGFINALGYVLQFQGILITSSSNAALIISTAALMIPVLSLVYVHEKMGMRKMSGVLLGFIGIVLLVTRGQAVSLGSSEVLGDFLILGTAVTIALVFILSKGPRRKEGRKTSDRRNNPCDGYASASNCPLRPEPFDQSCSNSCVLRRFPSSLRNGWSVLFLHEGIRIRLSNNFFNNS